MVKGKGLLLGLVITILSSRIIILPVAGNFQSDRIYQVSRDYRCIHARDHIHGHYHFIIVPDNFCVQVMQVLAYDFGSFFIRQQRIISWFKCKLEQVVHGCFEFIEFIID
ncbi:MAG: hypothetical protein CVV30_05835 [Methanomicrobiales archaeon HGW-Methanomicrobiales-1]|nr:MAG: hypothetical protein CVV30_05835 [Methanomicrobiales archaeon HGW-Methanomicrobiales-1]